MGIIAHLPSHILVHHAQSEINMLHIGVLVVVIVECHLTFVIQDKVVALSVDFLHEVHEQMDRVHQHHQDVA